MKKTNDEQKEYLLLKIKSPSGVDFYSDHKAVIDRCGYVDFAKVGNSVLKTELLKAGDIIYIKESVVNGGALYAATLKEVVENGKEFPAYYNDLEIANVFWLRLSDIKPIENKDYLDGFETRAGGKVSGALKSMSPNFYIRKRAKK